METTILLAKIIGPVLIARGISLIIDRKHFLEMVKGLEKEVSTISFSMVPVFLMMAGIALLVGLDDWTSPAGIFFHILGICAILKTSLLMLFPRLMILKAQTLTQKGFLNVVAVMSLGVGAWLSVVGYLP